MVLAQMALAAAAPPAQTDHTMYIVWYIKRIFKNRDQGLCEQKRIKLRDGSSVPEGTQCPMDASSKGSII
jgi:hypothetical protein